MRLLLIEDDRTLSVTLRISLTKAGYETEACENGADGLLFACSQAYDCLIIDRMLPEMDGLTLLQAIRRRGNHTPVIFSTALDRLNDRIDGLDAGADDYIVKPYAVEELLARIRAVTRRQGRISENENLEFEGMTLSSSTRGPLPEHHTLFIQKRDSPAGILYAESRQNLEPRDHLILCLGFLR